MALLDPVAQLTVTFIASNATGEAARVHICMTQMVQLSELHR